MNHIMSLYASQIAVPLTSLYVEYLSLESRRYVQYRRIIIIITNINSSQLLKLAASEFMELGHVEVTKRYSR